MFKLISLTSPTKLFNDIVFKDGLNIILGRYSKKGTDTNGIGKTTIINFIDYCLLGDGVKQELFKDKYSFLQTHTIELKFHIGDDKYSICRNFVDRKLALFRVNNGEQQEFIDTDLKFILGSKIGKNQVGIYDPSWFRTLMAFFVQNDHNFAQRSSTDVLKFTIGKRQPELITFIFLLLGIDNTLIFDFDNRTVELKELRSEQTSINKQITNATGKSIDDLRGECDLISRRVERLEKSLNNYTFDVNTSILEEKINELSLEISSLNKDYISLSRKHKDILSSLTIDVDVSPDKISAFYKEISTDFSEFIKKSLNEVLEFRSEISTNRKKFLKEREAYYQSKIDEIKNSIIVLEKERSRFFKMLDEKSAFDALKSAYTNLIEEKTKLSTQLVFIEQLDIIEEAVASKKSSISQTVENLLAEKNSIAYIINEIKAIFLDLVDNSVDIEHGDTTPYFSIDFKSNQRSPVKFSIEVPRGGSLGKGRFKILAFDLTIFIYSAMRNSNLPSFLIHDGVFHAISHKTRIKFLNYIEKRMNPIKDSQYIITFNEDEIIFPESEAVNVKLDFNLMEKTIAVLEDNPENMFLGREFG